MQLDDYARMRPAVLQKRAADGDAAAGRELARRGLAAEPVADVTTLDDRELRRMVRDWRAGHQADERKRNRELAERAYAELSARYRVDVRRWERGQGREPLALMVPGWLAPRPPRVADWERPRGSTCYPAEPIDTRDRFEAVTGRR